MVRFISIIPATLQRCDIERVHAGHCACLFAGTDHRFVLSPDPDDAMLRILQPLFTDRQVVCWRHRSDQA